MSIDRRSFVRYARVTIKGRRLGAHRAKIEQILGHRLSLKHEVHHRDGDGFNFANNNLIVCENTSYHRLLEARQAAYRATGDPNKRKCKYCKQYDDLSNMYPSISLTRGPNTAYGYQHRLCVRNYQKQRGKIKNA